MNEVAKTSNADAKQLAKLEKRIEANTKAAWRENGLIMLYIRNTGLYKSQYGTFESYLEKRWDYGKQYGHRLLSSAEFIQKLEYVNDSKKSPIGDSTSPVLPANEGQIRPLLTCLNHDGERLKVWADVVQDGEKITASLVQRKVDEFKASGQVVQDVEIKLPDVVVPNNVHVSKNSGDNEWYTPSLHIELARTVMGGIDCDPATSEIANRTIQAKTIFTAKDDGRSQKWMGRVWLNPPYSNPLMGEFIELASTKFEAGEIEQACVLVNNATETKWFQRMLEVASAVCFPKSRIKFLDPDGGRTNSPLQGQAIVYMGDNVDAFYNAFSAEGKVLLA